MKNGDVRDLQAALRQVLPDSSGERVDEVLSLGEALHQAGCREAALAAVESAVAHRSGDVSLWHAVAGLRLELGLPQAALQACNAALGIDADDPDTLFNTGVVLESMGDWGVALHCYERVLLKVPEHFGSLLNQGPLLAKMGRVDEARLVCATAVSHFPASADCHFNLGEVLLAANVYTEALAEFDEALKFRPDFARAEMAAAVAVAALGEIEIAEARRQKAIQLLPTIECDFRSPLAKDRDVVKPELRLERIALLAAYDRFLKGDPAGYDAFVTLLVRLTGPRRESVESQLLDHPDFPYLTLGLPVSDEVRRCVARQVSARLARIHAGVRLSKRARHSSDRLRIGYLSGDLRAHAVSWVIGGLFGWHDRERFEVYVYSTGPDDGSAERQRAIDGADVFREMSHFNGLIVAQAIAMDGIDILVDLSGHTPYSRGEALALRPAAIQVSYLGFKGTQGAPCIDYALLDRVIMLPEVAECWDEKIAYLPHCCSLGEWPQSSGKFITREAMGLPPDAVVMAALHMPRKIDPHTFFLWMSVLRRVSDMVIWLVGGDPERESSLKTEAGRQGVAAERLLFVNACSHEEFQVRLSLADFMIDAVRYNGHTTSLDALAMGVPVVTRAGREPVAREGASLLKANGFPELIAESDEAFVDLAVCLATNAPWRADLRQRLRARESSNLFCPERRVREIERAYEMMWVRHKAGLPPGDFDVPPLESLDQPIFS